MHGGRRLCAGHERRIDHRGEPGHDLPRRPASRESGHWRSRHRRRPRRRRCAYPALGRGRSSGTERRPRSLHRTLHRQQPEPHQTSGARRARTIAAALRSAQRLRRDSNRYEKALRYPRNHCAAGRRFGVRRIQGALWSHAGLRLLAHWWGYPVGIIANNGILFSEGGAQRRPFHRAVLPAQNSAGLLAETSPASWSAANTKTKASPATVPRW